MLLDFQQGIISYPFSGTLQRFLVYNTNSVNLVTTDGRVDIAFAHGTKNYLLTESTSITNAWDSINYNADAWLYWDIDTHSAVRTFGVTYVEPTFGTVIPAAPVEDQHWFNTATKTMMKYHTGHWLPVIRVFACKIHGTTFSPMGSGLRPYAGSQVALSGAVIDTAGISTGRILVDDVGEPIRRLDGSFVTSEDEIFVNGSPVNTIRLEANILNATAVENIARYQVVKFSAFGKISLAKYPDIQNTAIAMSMEDLNQGATGTLCMQGVITNPEWHWTKVGAPLWAHGTIAGLLVEVDPHVLDGGTFNVSKAPIARVLTPTSIFFDQGMGGKGDKGDQGSANVPLATETVYGLSRLSVAANDVSDPVVVGDNDIRNTNDRYPLPHNQAASTITTMPVGILTGANLQDDLQIINGSFVKRAGDTMTGPLTLSGDPASAMQAATKHYVDTRMLDDLSDVTITNPVAENVLKFDGTKWINGVGQSASLWMAGVHRDDTEWAPAEHSASLVQTDGYIHFPFASVSEMRNYYLTIQPTANTNINYQRIIIEYSDANVLTPDGAPTGNTLIIDYPTSNATTIWELAQYLNAHAEFSAMFSADVCNVAGEVGFAIIPNDLTKLVDDVSMDADMCNGYVVTCAGSRIVLTADGRTAGVCLYQDPVSHTSITDIEYIKHIPLVPRPGIGISIDGTFHAVYLPLTPSRRLDTIGQIVDEMDDLLRPLKVHLSVFVDKADSGLTIRSSDPHVSDLRFAGCAVTMFHYMHQNPIEGAYIAPIPGVPSTSTVKDPVLTPSPHVPAFQETYLPMHTCIESDPVDVSTPYWLAAVADPYLPALNPIASIGGIAVGQPGANRGYRTKDTVYIIGSTVDTMGVYIETRELSKDNISGELVTDEGYPGRVFVPMSGSNFTLHQAQGIGICVGNKDGDVYAFVGSTGIVGYDSKQCRADVVCLTPDLSHIKWRATISLGLTNDSNAEAWLMMPTSGICVNKKNNNIHVAIRNASPIAQPGDDYGYGSSPNFTTGVTVVTIDSEGNTLWTQSFHDRNVDVAWDSMISADIAVHEASEALYVSYNSIVAKLTNTGELVWSTDVAKISSTTLDHDTGITGLAVDQETGDVFFSSIQDFRHVYY